MSINAICLSVTASAQTSIYRCEKKGVVSFTNVKEESKGCKKIKITPRKSKKPTLNDKAVEKTFPKVSSRTQKKRDEGRNEIIRQELDAQKKELEFIIEKLSHFEITQGANQQKQIERFKAMNDERRERIKNVAELERQLKL